MENWILYTLIAILFFVIGQVSLKYDKNEAIIVCCYFSISMGIIGLLTLIYLYQKKGKNAMSYYGIIAGIFFFFGNFLWILSIKTAPSLSLIRIVMAGGETLLLLITGYLIFREKIMTLRNMLGILLILSGVYFISNA